VTGVERLVRALAGAGVAIAAASTLVSMAVIATRLIDAQDVLKDLAPD
jgi:uncharacterized protein with von Willebrand factor type A (vWA) domain